MRHVLLFTIVLFGRAALASAQVSERLDVSAIARTDRVSFEGDQHARLPVTGVGVSYRVWRDMRIEGEVTLASVESRRSYEARLLLVCHDARGLRSARRHREAHDGLYSPDSDSRRPLRSRRGSPEDSTLPFAPGSVAASTTTPMNEPFCAYRMGSPWSRRKPRCPMQPDDARAVDCCSVRACPYESSAVCTSRRKCVGCGEVRRG